MKYKRVYVGYGCNCKAFLVAENGYKIRRDEAIDIFSARAITGETTWKVIHPDGREFGTTFRKLAEAKEFLEAIAGEPAPAKKENRKAYVVRYKMGPCSEERFIDVLAANKFDAYDKAAYELIRNIEGCNPYSAWVESVTYSNGNVRTFNTCEGLPY